MSPLVMLLRGISIYSLWLMGGNFQGETDEGNNVCAVPISLSESGLMPIWAEVSSGISSGQQVMVSWIVQNVSLVPAPANWYDAVFFSTDEYLNGADIRLKTVPVGSHTPLGPGNTYEMLDQQVYIPYVPVGSYYLLFVVDCWDKQPEIDEDNNVLALPVQISAADLQVVDIELTRDERSGFLKVVWTDTNTGSGYAAGRWYDRVVICNAQTSQILLYMTVAYDATLDGQGPILSGRSRQMEYSTCLSASLGVPLEITITVDAWGYGPEQLRSCGGPCQLYGSGWVAHGQ